MSQPYRIGWLNGKCVLVWRDAAGTRKRYSLGTSDPREAQRRAPAAYAELTRPIGKTVADLWNAYVADRQGRPILAAIFSGSNAQDLCTTLNTSLANC